MESRSDHSGCIRVPVIWEIPGNSRGEIPGNYMGEIPGNSREVGTPPQTETSWDVAEEALGFSRGTNSVK